MPTVICTMYMIHRLREPSQVEHNHRVKSSELPSRTPVTGLFIVPLVRRTQI